MQTGADVYGFRCNVGQELSSGMTAVGVTAGGITVTAAMAVAIFGVRPESRVQAAAGAGVRRCLWAVGGGEGIGEEREGERVDEP